jgi:mono/diheme cytochrome c family protein
MNGRRARVGRARRGWSRFRPLWLPPVCIVWCIAAASLHAGQDAITPPTSLKAALPAEPTGEQIFRQACATCHAVDGTGSPQSVVGFALPLPNGHDFPDFNDCPTNTVEPLGDWVAVATRGGPIRGLDRHMPAFGDALSADQIEKVVKYLWSFCKDKAWPRGDLNFPRAFFTEKAFPESETVWTTGVTTSGAKAVTNDLVYEQRIGARGQFEVTIPMNGQQQAADGSWNGGLGDVELAVRRTFYASYERGGIFAAGAAVTLPTGKEDRGLGNGFAIYEPFAMFGQMLGQNGFLQLHAGYEIPSDHTKGDNEAFLRTAVGYSIAQDQGFGRAWSPMAEVIVAKPEHGLAEWDVVPQMQVSLSKLQHILLSVGVRVPLNEREDRKPQVLAYFLWDWFDGGLFEFWK